MMFFWWIIGIIILVLDIMAIYDVLVGRRPALHKFLWILLIIIFPVLGLILYYLLGKSRSAL
jgi:hypothetical protein